MKALISCDTVFEVLTRGPFPAGDAGDADVDSHLRACHSCRVLAEALRPAVNLFHESMSVEEEQELPAYLGRVEEAVSRAQDPPAGNKPRGYLGTGRGTSAGLVMGGLMGLAASCLIWLAGQTDSTHQSLVERGGRTAVAESPVDDVDQNRRAPLLLASFGLPLSCYAVPSQPNHAQRRVQEQPASPESAVTAVRLTEIACCTRCHFAGGTAVVSRSALRTISTSCAACHQPSSTTGRPESLSWLYRESPRRAC
jgi:hypothetical protein